MQVRRVKYAPAGEITADPVRLDGVLRCPSALRRRRYRVPPTKSWADRKVGHSDREWRARRPVILATL